MRIGVVSHTYPPYRGGMGAVAQRQSEAMQKRGHAVHVFVPIKKGVVFSEVVESLRPLCSYGNAAFVPQLWNKFEDTDIVHLHYPFYGGAIATAVGAALAKKPLIITYHMRTEAGDWRDWIFSLYRVLVEPFILRSAKRIFVSSIDYAASVGLTRYATVQPLPFGVDIDAFSPGSTQKGAELRLVFVGGMDKAHDFKGVPELLRACALLPKTGWTLTCVGDGALRPVYERLVKELSLQGQVRFLGSCTQEALVQAYQEADVHVLPSLHQAEAFGLVTLEAAASGCASIVSDLPGVRTLVAQGETGWVVPPGDVQALADTIGHCLNNLSQVRKMGEQARVRVEELYDQRMVMSQLEDVYKQVIAS